jgi:hypothetical protein
MRAATLSPDAMWANGARAELHRRPTRTERSRTYCLEGHASRYNGHMTGGNDLTDFLLTRIAEDEMVVFMAAQEEKAFGPIGNYTSDGSDPWIFHVTRWAHPGYRRQWRP